MGKSIYVAIPCLGIDHELHKTLDWCLNSQSGENEINIHVAMIDRPDFYQLISTAFAKHKNITFTYHDIENNFGIGRARTLAASNYNNEDYFLQIDSHMYFNPNWDSVLIEKFEAAKQKLNHDKIILSCSLPAYWYLDKEIIEMESVNGYPLYYNEITRGFKSIYKCDQLPVKEISEDLYNTLKTDGFIPLVKLSAHLIFSDKNFAENRCLNDDFIFWEEESLQSIELLSNGFYLVFPNMNPIIYHKIADLMPQERLYSEEESSREKTIAYSSRVGMTQYEWIDKTELNYNQYIQNNMDKIYKYKKYCGVDILNGPGKNYTYPSSYIF